ncbi:2-Methylisocitrate lyase, PEP mutase family [Roseivivax lentus]|uniref:2-Methylisocitrate lyase, PEP mutase family n=1 Tax=Roseivivax lentus TaxID=633194 RepID=A0A1N7NJ87_9RHOB|nr:isocitrate lyase/phosphoenolpyruvate mutase family protein [Roseivivax lentus]SIS98360.1 2-Methylisocitrate lyase, PEP mutase family [Roseivivax lentus]
MSNPAEKHARFQALHRRDAPFVMPNPWDAGTARLLDAMGFEALATTSAGLAFALGVRDSFAAIPRETLLLNAAAIVAATDLPVSADLEDGFGAAPENCAETIRMAAGTGLVGGSIEDATGDPDAPIYPFAAAVDRVRAAAEAARDLPFVLTARAENYLWGRPDLADTIARLQAFSEAGAEVLYAPGLKSLAEIRTLCAEVDKPVNVVMGLSTADFTVDQLAEAGVTRISVGGSFARAALAAVERAAEEVLQQGSFTYAKAAIPDRLMAAMMSGARPEDRRG